VIDIHRPTQDANRLLKRLQDEIQRQHKLDTSPSASLSARIAYRQAQLEHINIILNAATTKTQARTSLPKKLNRIPILGTAKVQRLFLKVYNFLFKEQRTVNLAIVQAVRESATLSQQLSEQTVFLEEFSQGLNTVVGDRVGSLETRIADVETRLTNLEHNLEQRIQETGSHMRDALETRGHQIQQQFGAFEQRLGSVERSVQFLEKNHGDRLRYIQADMTQQKRLFTMLLENQSLGQSGTQSSQEHPSQEHLQEAGAESTSQSALQFAQNHQLDVFYRAFEDHFRGDRSKIRERLRIYLPILETQRLRELGGQILDLGCGRGEWLELLRDEGYAAIGLDLNQAMLEQCQEIGLSVVEGDALAHLKSLPDHSLAAITGFHIVEHLPFEVLVQLMTEAYRVVKPGGIVIFETPNPRNVLVGSCNFYFDPTHRNPIPPEILQFMTHYYGFEPAQILPLNPSDNPRVLEDSDLAHRFNELFYGSMDYAVIGYKE
jgi:SAM-dependent methyltransferase